MAAAHDHNRRPSGFPRRDESVERLAVLVTQQTFASGPVTPAEAAQLRTIRRAVRSMARGEHAPAGVPIEVLTDGDDLDKRFAAELLEAVHRAVGDATYPSAEHRRFGRAAQVLLARWPAARAAAQLLEPRAAADDLR